ncbi:hypothetical protein EDD18DRAFT_1351952 [Armillaria luteobubalina]|uniref:Uncharacterized protein n=1 Tax=Armillaria luteobubalina TaxID=153913 RepID=A0AA39Q6W7_9AGAR|nr:hypothetical protein EDD18DRAFT_1351952 [Armillaria luteobubalina]
MFQLVNCNNPALASSASPPSYEVATSTPPPPPPPPYDSIDMLVENDIHAIDAVEPTPLYNDQYTHLEDIGIAGFARSVLATVFEEDVDGAVE